MYHYWKKKRFSEDEENKGCEVGKMKGCKMPHIKYAKQSASRFMKTRKITVVASYHEK
jgi:hypothetical protein